MISEKRYSRTDTSIKLFFVTMLIIIYILSTIMPFFTRIIDARIYMIIIGLLYFMIIFESIKSFNDSLQFMLPFSGVLIIELIYAYNFRSDFLLSLYDQYLLLFSPALCFYLLRKNHKRLINWVVIITVLSFLITAITSYFGLLNDPSAARWLAGASDSQDFYYISLNLKNIGGYTTVYSCVILFPMLIGLFKQNRIRLYQFIGIIVSFGLYLLYAQYTTALILFFGSTVLIFLPKKLNNKRMIYIGISIVAFIIILRPILGDFIYYLSFNSKSIEVSERLYVVGDLLKGIENTTQSNTRTPLILYDIRIFLRNPVFGSMFSEGAINSKHSYILNMSAKAGLFGISALLVMYIHIYKMFYLPFRSTPYYGYMIWCFSLGVILSTVNTGSWLFVITFVIPMIAYSMQDGRYKCLRGKGILM